MFQRKIRSALLVDYDNVVGGLTGRFPRSVGNWLSWLEDGGFTQDKRKRHFVTKRVYWNFDNRDNKAIFERHGFETYICFKRTTGKAKNVADMIIALDALQLSFEAPQIEEYIILSADTDFVPLLERLKDRKRQTIALAKDNASSREYERHADHTIDVAELSTAFDYTRAPTLWRRLQTATSSLYFNARRARIEAPEALNDAAEHLRIMAKERPDPVIGRSTVNKRLRDKMPNAYRTSGRGAYLGLGGYDDLINLISRTQDDFSIREEPSGGATLVYTPQDPAPCSNTASPELEGPTQSL